MHRTPFLLLSLLTAIAACGGPTPAPVSADQPAPSASAAAIDAPGDGAEPAPSAEAPAPSASAPAPAPLPPPVTVTLQAKSGSKLTGTATLTAEAGGVRVKLEVAGIKPGKHGSHVHEKGDCSAADGASAGGHFNPGGHGHSLPGQAPRHLGDLGNIEVGPDGKGTLEILAEGANLLPEDPSSFLGRAIIVHEKADDGGQPVGNAGGRIGCGVIQR